MKKKIFMMLALLMIAVTGAWAQDADNCPNVGQLQSRAAKVSRRAAASIASEVTLSFDCTSGYQYGVASDGEYIYTSSWSNWTESMFFKYDLDGNFIEEFNIDGCGYCRDMTYDGEYFYGVACNNYIYKLDFNSKSLVSTINTNMSMRGITYDPKRDGFWVVGNWSAPLALYGRDGNKIQEGIYAGHVSGIAYYEDNTGEEHILQFHNQNRTVIDYNITTNTIQDNVFNLATMPGYSGGTTGGGFIGEYKGEICMFGDLQQSPNRIGIYPIANAKAMFDLTVGENAHGKVTFKVGDKIVYNADEGDVVTVTVTPDEGYVVKEITGQWYAAIAQAPRRTAIDLLSDIELTAVEGEENQWTFTMERANAEISCTYTKVMKDDWIQTIEDQTYTGEALEPTIVVMDGETVLEEGTDYTVTYSNNVQGGGTGTVTVTGIGNYSGTVSKTFNVVAAVYSTANAAIDVNVPQGLGQLTQETIGQTTDLYYFLQSYLQNSPNPAYIKLRLEAGAQYVISKPLTVLSAITIEGDAEAPATIDATALGANPFVKIDNNYTSGVVNAKGFCTNIYDVTFKSFQLKGLKGQVFYANKQKYLIPYFTVDNCIFRMEGASSKTFFDFNSGGYVENFTLTNSTLSGDDATTWSNGGFFSTQSGSKRDEAGASVFKQTITNNTFYNVANGRTQSTLKENDATWMSFEVKNNIVVNSGKKGQFVKGLCAGWDKTKPSWLVQYNSFQWIKNDGTFEDISASEITGAPNCAIAANVEGEIVFANGAEGIAEGDFSLDACPQKEAQIGDPRWLSASLLSKLITPESLDDDNDLAKAINQGVQDGFVKFQLAENRRYTVKQSIVADKGLVIRGKNVVIDVEHADALVLLSKTPTGGFMPKSSTETAAPALTDEAAAAQNRAGEVEYTDYYKFDKLTLSGLKVNGLKNSIIYDNNVKYCVIDLTIDDCVMQLETQAVKNEALIAFQAGGVNNLTIKNSTFYGNNEVAKYFVRYNNSARIDRFGFDKADDTWSFTYENNTFYGLLKSDGQWGNYSGIVGKNAQGIVTVKNNIWYDCDAQTMRRMLGSKKFSQFSSASQMENNTFIVDGEAVDQGDYGNGSDLTGEPGFKRPAEGDFTLSAYSEQFDKKTGDPRWYAEGGHYNPVTAIDTVKTAEKADDGAWYTIQGIRTDKPAKGLYIHNGKKVIVK